MQHCPSCPPAVASPPPLAELAASPDWSDWRWQMAHAVRDPREACRLLGLPETVGTGLEALCARQPMFATPYYLSLARPGDATDPILKQCLPSHRELDGAGDDDPLAEGRDSPVPGLVHRYADRVLLTVSNACAVHCRHCMRRRFWSTRPQVRPRAELEAAMAYIAGAGSVREVIVSGGDPLLLPEEDLDWLLSRLAALPGIELIRIGSRLPAVLPQRLDAAFCALLAARPVPVWLATHFNHPAELTPAAANACDALLRHGVPMLNQTVLLRGINDDAETMSALCRGLVRLRVKPYYLFHGDPVAGTGHFRTGLDCGLAIMGELEKRLSGLAVPAFAFDLPDGRGKVRLEPTTLCGTAADGRRLVRDATGTIHAYAD